MCFQYEQFNLTRLPQLTKAVFVAFAVLVPILLLNMLIAMMGNTYQQIIRRSEKEWKRQVRVIIYLRQRRYMFCPCSSVCLSVCPLARLLKNACMDLDEMLRVNRCRDMDELIKF